MQSIPVFPEVPYNPVLCVENRILVPENTFASRSPGAAAYRVLRTRLLHRTRTNEWTKIGITSPAQGDGKSVTALNLAISVAREANNSVFLLDLDMRNPKMCKYLGTRPPIAIDDYLSGNSRPEQCLFSTGIENLTLAGSLTGTENASELLASQRIGALFDYICEVAYKPLILVDLPPLLSTDDALIVADKVDACLLVLSEGNSRRDHAAEALELLSEFNLAGILMNRSSAAVSEYYGS
jgi:capsular exopolysaccharide synthesis family protein